MFEIELDDLEVKKELDGNNSEADIMDVDKALDLIEQDQKEVAEKKAAEVVPQVQPEISIDDITNLAMESYKDIQKHSEEIYNAFYGRVATNQDRTDVSKQMLTDSQRLKIESINALASLANAKAKLISAQNKASHGNVGVFVNAQKGEDVGINLSDLADLS